LALATNRGMKLQQFDIGTSFLNGDLLEEIYMVQLEGFKDPKQSNDVCLLFQSLYGLKQSAKQWNKKMDKFLKQWELISSDVDSCIYCNKGELHTLLGIYVDDGIIASLYPDYITSILNYFETNFKAFNYIIKGGMEYFVGFQRERDLFSTSIFVYQTRYIDDIVERFGMCEAHPISTPVDTHTKFCNRIDLADPPINVPYKEAIGCFMYTILLTQPDINYAANLVAKFQPKPKQSHWTAIKCIYRYLKVT
jgi:hypothetical protein